MEKEFVPKKQSQQLADLGFNEPCLATYADTGELVVKLQSANSKFEFFNNKEFQLFPDSYAAPLWQQAFDWFREKHNMLANVYSNASGYLYEMHDADGGTHRLSFNDYSGDCEMSGMFTTYEKARTALVEKLIEIVSSC